MFQALKKLKRNKDGATAVEVAIVFPLLIMCLFVVLGVGVYMFGTHKAQRTVEQTAREARVLSEPTETELEALLDQNSTPPPMGSYQSDAVMLTQFGGEYARLIITYNFSFEVPFLDKLNLKSESVTEVKLREMPAI